MILRNDSPRKLSIPELLVRPLLLFIIYYIKYKIKLIALIEKTTHATTTDEQPHLRLQDHPRN